ncbi:hypothetical protein KJ830_07250, partial [bacterium]|nr:hypothetical protein [bacterium]
ERPTGAWQSQVRQTLYCFLMSFPLLFIVILWAYAIRPYSFYVFVGAQWIVPFPTFFIIF